MEGIVVLVANMPPLGRSRGIGFNAWATGGAYIFQSRRNDLDRDYLADLRALGLLEVQPG